MKRLAAAALAVALTSAVALAQAPAAAPPPSPQASAPVDLTGYWVPVITEDWRFRMVVPPKDDFASIPVTPEGRKVGAQWNPAMDGSCLAYGAAGLMRMPARFHITWQDGSTIKIDSDAGQQTRLLRFGAPPPAAARSLQGTSVAEWDVPAGGGRGGRGGGRGGAAAAPAAPRWAPLKVTTTNLTGGWLRRNGYPYSENAVMTEHFIRFADGTDEWLTITTRVDDPRYLTGQFTTSTNFKREPDGSKFKPTACTS